MVEATLATVILGIAVTAIAAALSAGAMQTAESVATRQAGELALAMLEEILVLPYDDPQEASALGPEAGESTRSAFDNIDDFHGYAELAGAVADANGVTYPAAYAAFSRSVSMATSSLQPTGFTSAVGGLTITVTVSSGQRVMLQVDRFVAAPPS